MSFYSNQSATPLLDQVAATAAQIKYMQEQYCAVLLSEVGLQGYCDPLKALDLLRCPQVDDSEEVKAFLRNDPARDLLVKVSGVAGSGDGRLVPDSGTDEFIAQLKRAFTLLRDKRAAYEAYTDQMRTTLATQQLKSEAAITTAPSAPASNATGAVAPEKKRYFVSLMEKAVQRTEYGSGSCRPLRVSDMPSSDLVHSLYLSLATTRPSLPPFGSLKIGREHGVVLIPRKNNEPEGGPPPRFLQLTEFEILCWALAIAGAIFVQRGEISGSFSYDLASDFMSKAQKDTPEANAGEKMCLCAGKLSLFMEVARDMRRYCEADGREGAGATNYQTQELVKSFYTRLNSALSESANNVTLNQAVKSLYEAGGTDRLFMLGPDRPQGDFKRRRPDPGPAASSKGRGRGGGGRGRGRGGDGKKRAFDQGDRSSEGKHFKSFCKQHKLCIDFQSGTCKKEAGQCQFLHKLVKDL